MSNIIKFALLFVGAILIAIIVRVAINISSRPATAAVSTTKVRVSAADLPQGLLMRDDDLRWLPMAADKIPAGAIVADAPGSIDLKGALLRHAVAAGAVIVAEDVILPNAPGFLAATLKPEMRAVSVAVDDVSGNAGLIQPGDYVDLLLTQQLERKADSTPDRSVSSETIVEQVRVLASGSDLSRPTLKSGEAADRQQRVRTVTLEVTPRMSEIVAVAARLGSLSLSLRSFATASRDPLALRSGSAPVMNSVPPEPVWAGDVSRAMRDVPKAREVAPSISVRAAPMPRSVAIYRGSERTESMQNMAQAGSAGGGNPGAAVGLPPLPNLSAPR